MRVALSLYPSWTLSEGRHSIFRAMEYECRNQPRVKPEVEFYDSRYVVKDTETGKFYKWNIVVANGTTLNRTGGGVGDERDIN